MQSLSHFQVSERSQVAEVRRAASLAALKLGFTETVSGEIAVVTTELANNLVRHARNGEILLSSFEGCLQVLSVDRGPGMNVEACLRDGFSTAGTAGTGLGAVRRMAHYFDAYSLSSGTILAACFGTCDGKLGVARVPKKGEPACGDSWSVIRRDNGTWILMADGLGHGDLAAKAADLAVSTFEKSRFISVASVVEEIHLALRPTRGAAIAVARMADGAVEYCGLGNIGSSILSNGKFIHMVSMGGTAGLEARKINPFSYRYEPGSVLLMHSDGLQTQWGLEKYPGILRRHPAIAAGALYRDYSRGRDDVTVLVMHS